MGNHKIRNKGGVTGHNGFDIVKDESDQGMLFNKKGYRILHQCQLPKRFFIEGFEMLDDGKTLLISSGLYEKSFIAIM